VKTAEGAGFSEGDRTAPAARPRQRSASLVPAVHPAECSASKPQECTVFFSLLIRLRPILAFPIDADEYYFTRPSDRCRCCEGSPSPARRLVAVRVCNPTWEAPLWGSRGIYFIPGKERKSFVVHKDHRGDDTDHQGSQRERTDEDLPTGILVPLICQWYTGTIDLPMVYWYY